MCLHFTFVDATRVRKDYDESSAKLSKIQSRISSLTQKLKHDFGRSRDIYLKFKGAGKWGG